VGISIPQIGTVRERPVSAVSRTFEQKNTWVSLANALFFCTSRIAFVGFLLLTSVYCLLLYVPFAYFGFIHNALLGWLPAFVRLHGVIYAVLVSAVSLTLIPDLLRNETRSVAAAFLGLNAGVSVYLCCRGSLGNLQPDFISFLWGVYALIPLLLLAVVDLFRIARTGTQWLRRERRVNIAQTTIAAAVASGVFMASTVIRGVVQGNQISHSLLLRGLCASLCFHVVIFATVGLILVLIRLAVSRHSSAELLSAIITGVFAWFLFVQLLRTMILPTISFEGFQADAFAGAISFVILLSWIAISANWRRLISSVPRQSIWIRAAVYAFAAVAIAGSAYAIPVLLGPTDWDFVLQRIAVVAVWLFILEVVCWTGLRVRAKAASIALVLAVASATVGFTHYARSALYNPEASSALRDFLDTYSGADISFKTAYDVLSSPVHDNAYRQFYEFLKQHTNLGDDVPAGPVNLPLVSDLRPTPGIKPNIFVFVIDSLRQDYISPYNPGVDYTPEIGRFAHDSVVLKNAFTRYGGTALSEPAIWVGAMQLHKQYIEPFYPMNNLQKLLDTDGYHSYISVDPILYKILRPSESITPLDTDNKLWGDLDFVPTLKELESKIDSRSDREKPIFAYTQPQNVHTITLARSKIKGGRRGASIFELRRMDAAFGEFVQFLQQRGLYDNSIIILTADHGDCYGEFGRYGHADFLFPQVIRIPLIVHLPPRVRKQVVWDANEIAFTTDVTPSLYYLLGHRPILNKELFGRPLFTRSLEEQTPYLRSRYLLVSSYAPVYAMLGGEGQWLFIVDAVNSRNYYYDLIKDPQGLHNRVTMPLRNENETFLRHQLALLDTLYDQHLKLADPIAKVAP
jgi:Sulfatase